MPTELTHSKGDKGIKIRVPCPTCKRTGSVFISEKSLEKAGNGMTVISVPANLVCEHAFQFFVDENGAVRGSESTDYELKADEQISEGDKSDGKGMNFDEKDAIHVIRSLMEDEIFLKCMRACLTSCRIICISDHWYIKEHFKPLFERIFEKYPPNIEVIAQNAYNPKNGVDERQFDEKLMNGKTLIFNVDLGAILQDPFGGNFIIKNFQLEHSIMEIMKRKDNKDIFSSIHSSIDRIFERLPFIQKDIKYNRFKTIGKMEKWIEKNYLSDLKFTSSAIFDLLKYRFGLEITDYFPEGKG